jgi:hypothetical protein
MNTSQEPPFRNRRQVRDKVGEGPAFYANSTFVTMSLFDFMLDFGQIKEASPSVLRTEDVARVIMSPQHTQSILDNLGAESERIRIEVRRDLTTSS